MTDLRAQLQTTLGAAYTLERELGGGGMSRVFLAEEASLGRKVVVKVLPPDLAAGVNVDRFRREIQLSAKLQHPHIVPVLSTGETNGVPYYTMPFVEGESLRARLAKAGPLPIAEAVSVLRDTAKALAYAHERGVVHRDIKPDNILLTSGSASVADFGIAKAISAARTDAPNATLTQVGTSIGTPAYMAPEQAAGDPSTDHRADLYALGCMAYETLTGRPPFTASSPHKLLAAHMAEAPADVASTRADTPASLAALIMKCLAKDPASRPANAAEVVAALDNVTTSDHAAMPGILLGGPGTFRKALTVYAAAFVVIAIVARAAVIAIGLPDWVFGGSLVVMALGLPVILFTGYVHHTTRRLVTATPKLTPGGTAGTAPQGTMQTLAMKASPHLSWRRTTLGGVFAIGAFIVIIGAFMLLRAMGIGPVGSLLAAGKFNAREPLLVTDFTVRNADSTLGRVLSDAAKTQLGQSSVITLMSPEGVADALRRMERPTTSALDLALARDLAVRNRVRIIVDGDLTGIAGGGYFVTMRLVTADSATELASFTQTANTPADLIKAVDALSRKLRGKVGESLKTVRDAPDLARATTGSLEALRKYSEAIRAEQVLGKRDEAITLLREAVKIDTAFAEAWRKLAIVLANGQRPRAQFDSAFTQAYRFRDRVPENARDMIIGGYFSTGPGRDRGRAVAAYEAVLRSGDSSSGAANNLALLLTQRREIARAESLYRAHLRLDPTFRIGYGNLAASQARMAKFASAESTYNGAVARYPDMKEARDRFMIDALYRRGDTAAYRSTIDSMWTKGDSSAKGWARFRVQNLALYDGRLARYRTMLNETRPAANSSSPPTPRMRLGWALQGAELAINVYWLKRPDDVARQLDETVAALKGQLVSSDYTALAGAYSLAGRPEKARQFLARFETEVKDTVTRRLMIPAVAAAHGDVLAAEGKAVEAAEYYRRGDRWPDGPVSSCTVCLSMGLASAFDRAGVADSAIKYYEHYVTTYDYDRLFIDPSALAVFSKRLGELYEQKGDQEKAARYYQNFVNLWRNADAELQPQVAEVRRRLSRLADVEKR
ncbi:MAG: protein kinase domain-containing protein [Gemmatimonadaceae bacterium]